MKELRVVEYGKTVYVQKLYFTFFGLSVGRRQIIAQGLENYADYHIYFQ